MGLFADIYGENTLQKSRIAVISDHLLGTLVDAVNRIDTEVKLIGLTSTQEKEGVTTVTHLIANALCTSTYFRSLVVDAGLHNPAMHRVENIPEAPGLSDVILSKELRWKEAIKSKKEPVCYVLPAGKSVESLVDFFMHPRVYDFLKDLRSAFNFVLFDLPPVGTYPEILPFISELDAVLFVVRAHYTRVRAAQVAVDRLKRSGVLILGGILNRKRYYIPETFYKMF